MYDVETANQKLLEACRHIRHMQGIGQAFNFADNVTFKDARTFQTDVQNECGGLATRDYAQHQRPVCRLCCEGCNNDIELEPGKENKL